MNSTFYSRIGKRWLDAILSFAFLILSSPLLLLAALAIRLTSRGPIFFRQTRVGQSGKLFRIFKLRTMIVVDDATGSSITAAHDPRITPVGRWLRRTKLDELPQLINVLRGDMSLVGPRPLPIRDYQGFDEDWVRRRFSVRPGITCLWQVNGRSSVSFQRWMELDLHYIDHWSLWLDVKVIFKTIPAVFKGVGAA